MKERIETLAREQGFDAIGHCKTSVLRTHPEVRDMCAANLCHAYGASWSCPPACGEVEDYEKRVHAFENCMVVQTLGRLEDEFDFDSMSATEDRQNERFRSLVHALLDEGFSFMALGAGPCMLCEKCTYPDNPCRFPDHMAVSMEAAGFIVAEVCTEAGVPYNHGLNAISFTGCICY